MCTLHSSRPDSCENVLSVAEDEVTNVFIGAVVDEVVSAHLSPILYAILYDFIYFDTSCYKTKFLSISTQTS
jgi:hypothetical protein